MNLLTEPLLPVLMKPGDRSVVDLPTLLAAYADDLIFDLSFLRPHQRAPWHSFCVQLAALALHRAGRDAVVTDAATWRDLLRQLTADWPEDEPWRLVVEDVTKPAFMQPPVPAGSGDPHRTLVETADDLDVLVTAKNHGIKQSIGADASPAAWVAALVTAQTCGDYSAAGAQERYYGTVRRNGSYATRPFVGLVPPGGVGAHWRRDVAVLLRHRAWFLERVEAFAQADGAALLWCLPWDGEQSFGLEGLDPWFIEICRRVRLYRERMETISAKRVGSAAERIVAKCYKGNIGDPWIPIDLGNDSAAYNTTPRYSVMSKVLFDRNSWQRPLLLDWHKDMDALTMTARFDIVVRGDGKTKGHYIREVPIEGETRLLLFQSAAGRDRMAELGRQMINDVRKVQDGVLQPSLYTLMEPDLERNQSPKRSTLEWTSKLLRLTDQAIEPVFFDHFFARAELGRAADQAWVRVLRTITTQTFEQAVAAIPTAGARRLKAIAVAEEKLRGLFFASFKGYLAEPEEEAADVG